MLNPEGAPGDEGARPDPPPSRAPGPGRYVLGDQVGHLLRRAHQRHTALFSALFAESSLTPTQWAALAALAASGPIGQNELGRGTAMDPATIQGVVRRLASRGLVRRNRDPGDRRLITLALTPAGRACYEAALASAARVSEATLARLDPGERARFLALLRRLA